MKFYFVRHKKHRHYLQILDDYVISWVDQEQATVYRTREQANNSGEFAFDYSDDAGDFFEIEEIDTDAAVQVIRDLFDAGDLEDHVYDIREREGQGWDGPQVNKWYDAYKRACELMGIDPDA